MAKPFTKQPGFWLMIIGLILAIIGFILLFLKKFHRLDYIVIVVGGLLFVGGAIWAFIDSGKKL